MAPRPVGGLLRPIIQCSTARYNMKTRYGKGFTFDELKAANISKKYAMTIGIAVDHRRTNQSQQIFDRNVARLNDYQSKLVLADKSNIDSLTQNTDSVVLPVSSTATIETRLITDADRASRVFQNLQKERLNARLAGHRAALAKKREEEAKLKKLKKGKRKK